MPIYFYSTRDNYGCGTNGTGKNMLGKILCEVREQIRTLSSQG
jgi:predicted NAD-dependent protein-ADP-ribosyltransferase YbiA (DUF1768 family)